MGGKWYRPHGATPTTHILKLPLGLVGNMRADMSESVENEWLCGRILSALGFDVAPTAMATFGDSKALAVTRFDRRWQGIEPGAEEKTRFKPPRGAWIARWPLSFIVGTFAGLQLIGFLHGDFLAQIRNTILPLAVMDGGAVDFWASLRNLLIVGGVLCAVIYFFFSFEHKGAVGGAAKVGIWFLMITFGAAFGYTVMGRIALLAIRFEFLLDDWLWLIDPSRRRAVSMLLEMGSGAFFG